MSLLPEAVNLWRCSCGHLNEGRHGAFGLCNDDGPYDVCYRCRLEVYAVGADTGKAKAEAYYLAVPIARPWVPTPS